VFVPPETRHATSAAARVALALTVLVLLGVLVQAVLAGDFYGGAHHRAIDVHKALGPALLAPALLVVVICAARLRIAAAGRRALAAAAGTTLALVVEAALGFGSDQHPGLLVLHIPVALGLFAMLTRQVMTLRVIARPAEPARR
jgi:cytochrome bd-type quinol oxidase subunit 2